MNKIFITSWFYFLIYFDFFLFGSSLKMFNISSHHIILEPNEHYFVNSKIELNFSCEIHGSNNEFSVSNATYHEKGFFIILNQSQIFFQNVTFQINMSSTQVFTYVFSLKESGSLILKVFIYIYIFN